MLNFDTTLARGGQPAKIYLRLRANGTLGPVSCKVVRITPDGLRLSLTELPAVNLQLFYDWNKSTTIILDMPRPVGEVTAKVQLSGVAVDYTGENPPLILDLEFPDLTAQEEQALRESNPDLVVV